MNDTFQWWRECNGSPNPHDILKGTYNKFENTEAANILL